VVALALAPIREVCVMTERLWRDRAQAAVTLLGQAEALIEALMHERHARRLVWMPPEGATLYEIERAAIAAALERTWGHQANAGRLLGVTTRVMNYKVKHVHRMRCEGGAYECDAPTKPKPNPRRRSKHASQHQHGPRLMMVR